MSIIGIVTNNEKKSCFRSCVNKYIKYLKRDSSGLEKNNSKNNIVVCIKKENLKNIRNIKFELLLLSIDELDDESWDALKKIINNSKYLIINYKLINFKEFNDFIKENNNRYIIYGDDLNSDIKISSIDDNKIMISVRNGIKDIDENEIDGYEIEVLYNTKLDNEKIMYIMEVISVLVVYGGNEKIIL